MAEIKSALEIALSRTEGMEVDRDKIRAKEHLINGRKAALAFIDGKSDIKEFIKVLKKTSGDEKKAFKSGAAGSFMALLKLPSDENYKTEFAKAEEGLGALAGNARDIKQMFEQLTQFFDQYLQTRQQIEQQLMAQFKPVLKQKEDAIFAQTGTRINLDPMDDPDFQKVYAQNAGNLSKNYLDALNQAKGQLKEFLGLED